MMPSLLSWGYFEEEKDILVKALYKCMISFPVCEGSLIIDIIGSQNNFDKNVKIQLCRKTFTHLSQLAYDCPWGKNFIEVADLGHLFSLFSRCQEMAVSLHGPFQLARLYFQVESDWFPYNELKKFFFFDYTILSLFSFKFFSILQIGLKSSLTNTSNLFSGGVFFFFFWLPKGTL